MFLPPPAFGPNAVANTERTPRRVILEGLIESRVDHPFLVLAPMEGISDSIVRDLLSGLGGMDLSVTEFIRVAHARVPDWILRRECPELDQRGRTPAGTPVMLQLLGSQPNFMAETAVRAIELGAFGIDLNFGCPAKRVNGSDGGAVLLREPTRVQAVIAAVREACPADIPVSAKVRLGWEDPDDIVPIARAVERGGADWITIHGRTKAGMYKANADWTRIARARQSVSIPVIANGDIFSPEHLRACAQETECTAFMLGRGAFRDPNLFRWIRGHDDGRWRADRRQEILRSFVARMLVDGRFQDPARAALNRLKQWVRAMAEVSEEIAECFGVLKHATNVEAAIHQLSNAASPLTSKKPERNTTKSRAD